MTLTSVLCAWYTVQGLATVLSGGLLCTALRTYSWTMLAVWDIEVWAFYGIEHLDYMDLGHMRWSILFANHKANGVVTNIGLSR